MSIVTAVKMWSVLRFYFKIEKDNDWLLNNLIVCGFVEFFSIGWIYLLIESVI